MRRSGRADARNRAGGRAGRGGRTRWTRGTGQADALGGAGGRAEPERGRADARCGAESNQGYLWR